jgi:hypothetical protein
MAEIQQRVWIRRHGAVFLVHPWRREEFVALAMTGTHLLLDLGHRQVRVEWDRVVKVELQPPPRRPSQRVWHEPRPERAQARERKR